MFAILANVMIVYSIVLLVWQHRFDDKQSAKADVNAPVKIYYHPSVMLSLWFVISNSDVPRRRLGVSC